MSNRPSIKGTIGFVLTLLFSTAVLAPGCASQPAQLCNEACDCVPCNDREHDECVIVQEAERDRAEAYDCGPEYDDYIDCALNDNDCDDDTGFTIDCADEYQELGECIFDASDLNGSGQGGDGATGADGGSGATGADGGGGAGATGGSTGTVDCDCTCECLECGTVPLQGPCDNSTGQCSCDLLCQTTCDAGCGGLSSFTGACI